MANGKDGACPRSERVDVHHLLDKIADRPAPIVANRTFAALRRMCSWAEERGLIDVSPCEKVRAPSAEKSHDRILSDEEIRLRGAFSRALDTRLAHSPVLLLLTGQRLLEVAQMRWTEVDVAAESWTIPKERTKNGIAHEVAVSEAALRVLNSMPRIGAGPRSAGLVFTTNGKSAVSGFSKAKAGFDRAMALAKGEPTPHWTLHDLRRSAASGMAGLGIPPHVVEATLNHKSGTIRGVSAVYNRYNYAVEKRTALQAWGRNIDALVNGKPSSNVVELAAHR